MPEAETLVAHGSVLSMVTGSGPVVQAVLVILIVQSVLSWAITIAKVLQFRRAERDSQEFSSIFWETKSLNRLEDTSRRLEGSPLAQLFRSGYREVLLLAQREESKSNTSPQLGLESIEGALRRAEFSESVKLERGLTFLASTASAAPFIGLFGTVWGIMNAFHGLSYAKTTSIQAVAPGISEALIATAVGLAAAIPAAIAFNYCTVAVRRFRDSMHRFSSEFLSLARASLATRG